ncbi:hypothetical protein EsH8_XI_000080 [Colletotrichum jinshuiense]
MHTIPPDSEPRPGLSPAQPEHGSSISGGHDDTELTEDLENMDSYAAANDCSEATAVKHHPPGLSEELRQDPAYGFRRQPQPRSFNSPATVPADRSGDETRSMAQDSDPTDIQPLIPNTFNNQEEARWMSHEPDNQSGSVEYSKETSIQPPSHQALWTSPWLQKTCLFGFACLFTVLWATLIVLWRYDVSNSGFVISVTTSPFSWTYSPTAILVVITGLWRQVDYHSKIHQPWQQMAKGPSLASNTVLLDYVSPMLPTGLLKAVRNSHWTVAATITGSAVLKLVTVLSTALMVPVSTRIAGPVPVGVVSTFDDSSFWSTTSCSFINESRRTISGYTSVRAGYFFNNISAASAVTFSELLQGQISEPVGTHGGIAFQEISILQTPDIEKINTAALVTDTFVPDVNCEQLNITVVNERDGNITQFSGAVRLDVPSCGTPEIWLSQCADNSESCIYLLATYNIYRVYCSDSGVSEGPQTEARLLFVASNITQKAKPGSSHWDFDYTTKLSDITAVSCKVTYNVVKGDFTMDLEKGENQITFPKVPGNGERIGELTDRRLTELLYSVLVAADKELDGPVREIGQDMRNYTPGNDTSGSTAMFGLMIHTIRGQTKGYEMFFDGETMVASATSILNQLAVLFIHETFVVPQNATASAAATYIQDRLRFRELSLWLMIASFVILGLLSLSVILTFSPAVPQDPSLLASQAAILAQSPELNSLLTPLGGLRTSQISYTLAERMFDTVVDSSFKVQVGETSSNETGPLAKPPKHKRGSWIPMPARVYMVAITFALPLFAIAALEILYRKAVDEGGFAVQNRILTLYGTQYGSALIMLAIASLFSSLDFTVMTFSTFSFMGSRAVPSSGGLTSNPMRDITPVALFEAVRRGHFGLFSSNLAAMIGSVLTIIVSNLWVQKGVITETEISIPVATTWDLDWADSPTNDGGATTLLNDIRQNHAPKPDSAVWNDIVFPSFGAVSLPGDLQSISAPDALSRGLNFSIEVPSLRPRLFCQVTGNPELGLEGSGSSWNRNVKATFPLPPGCTPGKEGKDRTVSFVGLGRESDGWTGLLFDLYMGALTPDANSASVSKQEEGSNTASKKCSPCTTYPNLTRSENPMGCPSIGILFGGREDNFTGLVCSQIVQQVQVQLKFKPSIGPNDELVLRRSSFLSAPTPIESTATNLTGGSTGLEAFNYRIQSHFDTNFTTTVANDPSDPFFRYIISSTAGITTSELASNPELLIAAVSKLYSDFMVQVIDSDIFRKPLLNSRQIDKQDQSTFASGTVSREETRLLMNYTPKLILQILLAAMVVFGLAAFILVDLKGTLPRNPHSIASVMALFAGSEMCSNIIPYGAEWMGKRELDRLFQGYLFALGWWSFSATEADSQSIDSLMITPLAEERFGIDVGTPEKLGFHTRS